MSLGDIWMVVWRHLGIHVVTMLGIIWAAFGAAFGSHLGIVFAAVRGVCDRAVACCLGCLGGNRARRRVVAAGWAQNWGVRCFGSRCGRLGSGSLSAVGVFAWRWSGRRRMDHWRDDARSGAGRLVGGGGWANRGYPPVCRPKGKTIHTLPMWMRPHR